MTIRVIGDIILMQFSVWVHGNSSDSLWHKNLNSEEQWCIQIMQNILKKANTHLLMWNRNRGGEVEWQLIILRIMWHFKVHLENLDFELFYISSPHFKHPAFHIFMISHDFVLINRSISPPAGSLHQHWPHCELTEFYLQVNMHQKNIIIL